MPAGRHFEEIPLPMPEERLPDVTAAPHRHRVHFSSQSDEWATPAWLFDALDREFGFTLDPCSTHTNAKCPRHFTRAEDGIRQSWAHEVVWMNPPYGRAIEDWMAKAFHSCEHERATVVCLVPSRTDTRWWHRFAMPHEKRFLRGRLRFGNARFPAPFPSAIVVMRPSSHRLVAVNMRAKPSGRKQRPSAPTASDSST